MDYVNLGRSRLKVSRLCLGCRAFRERKPVLGAFRQGKKTFVATTISSRCAMALRARPALSEIKVHGGRMNEELMKVVDQTASLGFGVRGQTQGGFSGSPYRSGNSGRKKPKSRQATLTGQISRRPHSCRNGRPVVSSAQCAAHQSKNCQQKCSSWTRRGCMTKSSQL